MTFEWQWTNLRDLRPYWPQTASKFEVRFQMRAGRFCHLLEKYELCFTGNFFIIFENISEKPIKFRFHCRIAHLCSVYTANMAAIQKILHLGNRALYYLQNIFFRKYFYTFKVANQVCRKMIVNTASKKSFCNSQTLKKNVMLSQVMYFRQWY